MILLQALPIRGLVSDNMLTLAPEANGPMTDSNMPISTAIANPATTNDTSIA